MNKTNPDDLRDTIAVILIDALAKASEAITAEIMRHVENALEDAFDTGREEGYEEGFEAGRLDCEQEYSEREY